MIFILIVYAIVIKPDDIELIHAKKLGISTMERAIFLGLITKAFNYTICISEYMAKLSLFQ